MVTSLSSRPEAAMLPSLPPSPSLLDEVFSHPRPWSVGLENTDGHRSRPPSSPRSPSGSLAKGKGKQVPEDEDDEDEDEDTSHGVGTHESYPPMTDEAAETRRVEETLKRWELAERQRRKSARESVHHTPGPSLFSSVTRTASLVLSHRASTSTAARPAGAFKLHGAVDVAREGYGVPLDDIDRTPAIDVAVHSPSPSTHDRGASLDTDPASRRSENPFEHPSERSRTPTPTPTSARRASTPTPLSPFADAHAQQAGHVRGDADPDGTARARKRALGDRASLVPPPRPLGLPPPPEDIPDATPLKPTPPPVLSPSPPRQDPEESQGVRWWHEWLCGCGEGPDRGGDNQAGRTNPFE